MLRDIKGLKIRIADLFIVNNPKTYFKEI